MELNISIELHGQELAEQSYTTAAALARSVLETGGFHKL